MAHIRQEAAPEPMGLPGDGSDGRAPPMPPCLVVSGNVFPFLLIMFSSGRCPKPQFESPMIQAMFLNKGLFGSSGCTYVCMYGCMCCKGCFPSCSFRRKGWLASWLGT